MTSTQKQRFEMLQRLGALGFTYEESAQLRRIAMTLHRWHEMECGCGDERVTRSIERSGEDGTGAPFMRMQYATAAGWVDRKWRIADREAGALRRLARIVGARNAREAAADAVTPYVQGDPRGAALYVLRAADLVGGAAIDSIYYRGLAVA